MINTISKKWLYDERTRPKIYISTSSQRRKAIAVISALLGRILDAECRYRHNIPYTPRFSAHYYESERFIAMLEDVICILEDIF